MLKSVKKTALSNIMMFEVVETIGQIRLEKVALYNAKTVSEKDAKASVRAGEYRDDVLCIPRKQWEAIFG